MPRTGRSTAPDWSSSTRAGPSRHGAATTGVADAFLAFSWFSIAVWLAFGWWGGVIWARATTTDSVIDVASLWAFLVIAVYFVSQGYHAAWHAWLFHMVPDLVPELPDAGHGRPTGARAGYVCLRPRLQPAAQASGRPRHEPILGAADRRLLSPPWAVPPRPPAGRQCARAARRHRVLLAWTTPTARSSARSRPVSTRSLCSMTPTSGDQSSCDQAKGGAKSSRRLDPAVVVVPGWSHPAALAMLAWCSSRRRPAVLMSASTAHDERRRWWREAIKRRIVAARQRCPCGWSPPVRLPACARDSRRCRLRRLRCRRQRSLRRTERRGSATWPARRARGSGCRSASSSPPAALSPRRTCFGCSTPTLATGSGPEPTPGISCSWATANCGPRSRAASPSGSGRRRHPARLPAVRRAARLLRPRGRLRPRQHHRAVGPRGQRGDGRGPAGDRLRALRLRPRSRPGWRQRLHLRSLRRRGARRADVLGRCHDRRVPPGNGSGRPSDHRRLGAGALCRWLGAGGGRRPEPAAADGLVAPPGLLWALARRPREGRSRHRRSYAPAPDRPTP